ncbi:MAG: hypothetical protein KA821_20690 [Chitinophagaceae bacterium]|nr:hypothetical protein [Chitinophagaceae bacterium]
MKIIQLTLPVFFTCILFACSSPSNRRAVSTDELEKVQATDSAAQSRHTPLRDALSATELIELADCNDLPCVQLYMKERDRDFVHAVKGQFASLHRSAVTDTAGNELVMPLSTLYADVNPQTSWRLAHTLHRKETGERLLAAFHQLGFVFVDSGYYVSGGLKGKQARFSSPSYPGKSLYVTATYHPWYMKGLYSGKVTWPCYVFEVYKD